MQCVSLNAPVRIIAESDFVKVESRGRNTTGEGNDNTYCKVLRLEGWRGGPNMPTRRRSTPSWAIGVKFRVEESFKNVQIYSLKPAP